jgi:4-aminobutyrate aminotransferase-like enzyme/Ser/Thr protein kinase RdoA (MazF antagonist)
VDRDVLETLPPVVTADAAASILEDLYGLRGTAVPLVGERDSTHRVVTDAGTFVLKIGNPADPPGVVDLQARGLERALAADPTLPIPGVRRTRRGDPTGTVEVDGSVLGVQLVDFLDGRPAPTGAVPPAGRRAVGGVLARLARALTGFTHPLSARPLLWDVTRLPELRPKLAHLHGDRRALVEAALERYERDVEPLVAGLRKGTIHGDPSPANVLFDPDDPDRVTGLVDFGDLVVAPLVCDPAMAAAYLGFGVDDPRPALADVLAAYHAEWPLTAAEVALVPALAAARLAQSLLVSSWRVELHPENADYILVDADDCHATLEALSSFDPIALTTRLLDACGLEERAPLPLAASLALRATRIAPSLTLTYRTPVHLTRGDGVWLEDADGRRLLDAYNNVPQVGHGHPRVANAIAAHTRRLATNTRYLVDEVSAYADRLASLFPAPLSTVLFVNSGSEANDLAYQIARVVTGADGVLVTDHAYHGTTAATAAFSPEELGGRPLAPWVATIGGAEALCAPDAPARLAAGVDAAVRRLEQAGRRPALLMLDSVFSSDGIFTVSPGLLAGAYAGARAAGALCVADEVQAGFGRVGTAFWGFAQDDVVPDVVTLGKPMGNGHPLGAVVTTAEIAATFAERCHFFSTFAGSPVAAAAGAAVLDVLEDERLPAQAARVGDHLRGRLARLARGDDRIRAVRGPGLFVGAELAGSALATAVVEALREDGVLIGRTGPTGCVLKIRPPLCFAEHHAERVVAALIRALETLEETP